MVIFGYFSPFKVFTDKYRNQASLTQYCSEPLVCLHDWPYTELFIAHALSG